AEDPPQDGMKREHGNRLRTHERKARGLEMGEKDSRRAIPAVELRAHQPRRKDEHHIARDDEQPIDAGENPVPGEAFEYSIVTSDIEVERLVVRTILSMMPDVSLPQEMKRRGEKERQENSTSVVDRSASKQHPVMRLVDRRVNGVHHHAETQRE